MGQLNTAYQLGVEAALRTFEKRANVAQQISKFFPRMGFLAGAGKGALVGGGVGGATGFLSADSGQGWEGFKRGLGRGALTGAAVGGIGGALRGGKINKALDSDFRADYIRRLNEGKLSLKNFGEDIRDIAGGNWMKGIAGGLAGMTGQPDRNRYPWVPPNPYYR